MNKDPIKNEILNIMSGKRQGIPQQKISKTHILNEDILKTIAGNRTPQINKNVQKVDNGLLRGLDDLLRPKPEERTYSGDVSSHINHILEESKKIPETVNFEPTPVDPNLLGRLENIFKHKEVQKDNEIIIPLSEEVGSYLKIDKPLSFKDGKLTVDAKVITENLEKKTEEIHQTVSKLSATVGGGAVGIVYDDGVNKENVIKSVNNIIFTGPGVNITRKGKDVEIYISGMDANLDFAREATMLDILSSITQIFEDVQALTGAVFPNSLTNIGGTFPNQWNVF
jgi:hypothetical protein